MPLTPDLIQAAQEVGSALRQAGSMQAFLAAQDEFQADPDLCALEAEFKKLHEAIEKKEQAGIVLLQQDMNPYHAALDRLRRSRLYLAREEKRKEAQFLLAQTAETISSILSVSYAGLVNPD